MTYDLEFEAPIRQLAAEVTRLERAGASKDHVEAIQTELDRELDTMYRGLTPWQTVQVARHRARPYPLDYVQWVFTDFVELHGDRRFGDDRAIIGGPATLDGTSVMVLGHQKGRDTKTNVDHNFGMPNPEGYRKAERLLRQAEKLRMPVVTFVDTPGANPSLPAEERGQAQAIAEAIATMLSIRVPSVAIVTGEGGSGGALAIAVADRILMLQHSVFTVASPEAAASILWRDAGKAPEAAASMRITAQDLFDLGIVDQIVSEPVGGAHRDPAAAAQNIREAIIETLASLGNLDCDSLLRARTKKYRGIGGA